MKAIKHLFFGILLTVGAISVASASYVYPYTQTYGAYTNNSIYTVSPSYYYNDGCYSYFYNGTTRNVSIIGYLCSNTNYNSNYNYNTNANYNTGYLHYTQPTTNTSYYYTVPTTYYTYPSYTYTYQNTDAYSYQPYYNSYNYNVGYTDTGYNNYSYYNNNYNYSYQNSCYWQNGYQVCY